MRHSVHSLVKTFQEYEPKNESQVLRNCSVGLKYLGEGSFRAAFEIIGLPLILKVPLTNAYSDLDHAWNENRAIEELLGVRKYKPLRKYAPKVHYFDGECGLMLMQKYRPVNKWTNEIQVLSDEITAVIGHSDHDIGCGNVGRDSRGHLKLIDLGMLMDDEDGDDEDGYEDGDDEDGYEDD